LILRAAAALNSASVPAAVNDDAAGRARWRMSRAGRQPPRHVLVDTGFRWEAQSPFRHGVPDHLGCPALDRVGPGEPEPVPDVGGGIVVTGEALVSRRIQRRGGTGGS